MFYNAWCHGRFKRHGPNVYDERDVLYDVRRHARHLFRSPYMLWDSWSDREDDYGERCVQWHFGRIRRDDAR